MKNGTMLAQMNEVMKAVDHASGASDRWLFIAALVIIMLGGSLAIKWLVASLAHKDTVHDGISLATRSAHSAERAEWKETLIKTEAHFLDALDKQRADFRSELLMERQGCAQERVLDRGARHATAEALQSISLSLSLLNEMNPELKKAWEGARGKSIAGIVTGTAT